MKKIYVILVLLLISACAPSASQIAYQSALDTAISEGKPLFIRSYSTARPNSAGGVGLELDVLNLSKNKKIKYLKYTVIPYNAVGDKQRGEISRKSASRLSDTGPYNPMEFIPGYWENIWYNSTITCMIISSVKIEYMDGTTKSYRSASSVQNIMNPALQNTCRVR